ncbi:hypothetical protein, partial [Undibacterium sp. TJN19]|uniref:hypothetical protein n=1 Tax=Undibacterium sp. TJN19 TaxID=3413055 RepID=UPI003BF17519
ADVAGKHIAEEDEVIASGELDIALINVDASCNLCALRCRKIATVQIEFKLLWILIFFLDGTHTCKD